MTAVSIKQRLFSGGLWALIGRVTGVFLAVAINSILARILSPDAMGVYFLALSLVVVAAIIAQLGLNQVIVRLVAESMQRGEPARAGRSILLVFGYGVLGSVVVASAMYLGVGDWLAEHVFHSKQLREVTGLIAIWIILSALQSLLAETFRGFHDIKSAALYGGVASNVVTAGLILAVWIFQNQTTLEEVIYYTIAGVITSNFIAFILVNKKYLNLRGASDLSGREVIQIAWPLLVTNLTGNALTQVGLWIVGAFLTQEDVAVFGAAARLSQIMMLVTSLLYAFLPPLIAQWYEKKDFCLLQEVLQGSALLNTLLVLPLLGSVILFPSGILQLLYGEFYSRGSSVLVMLSIGLFVNVLTGIRGYVLIMSGREKLQMYISLFGGTLNTVACVIGAIYWGINGVAFAAMFSMITQCIVELFAVKSRLGVWTHGVINPVKYTRKFVLLISQR